MGANVQPGSGVLLGADTAHLEIARAVVDLTEVRYRGEGPRDIQRGPRAGMPAAA